MEFPHKKNEIPPKKNKIKKRKKKRKGKKKNMNKNKKPHFSDRIDTIILPLEFAYKFKRNSTSPFIIQCTLTALLLRQWPVLVYSPSRSIGPAMDNPLNFSETDH